MKEIKENIKWSENSSDPNSRVFFIGDRVFRAFEEERRQEMMDFLNSEIFTILQKRGMLVKTWIPDDVHVKGYSLIVEHERIVCIPSHWMPFECLRGVLQFHFEIDTLCRQYGYALRDVGFDNVTLHNGWFCFVDLGSFRKKSNVADNIYSEKYLSEAVIPLALYHTNKGYDFIADTMIDYYSWWLNRCIPSHNDSFEDFVRPFLRPIIGSYQIKMARCHTKSLTIHNSFVICLLNILNKLASLVFHMPGWWRLFRIKNVYSEKRVKEWIASLTPKWDNYKTSDDIPNKEYSAIIIKDVLPRLNNIHRIVLWGNYCCSDIMELRKNFVGNIFVLTNDRVCADTLFKELYDTQADVYVIQSNVVLGRDIHVLDFLKTDLLVLHEAIIENARIDTHTIWAEKSAIFAKYILIPHITEKEKAESNIYKHWDDQWGNQYGQLYRNKLL